MIEGLMRVAVTLIIVGASLMLLGMIMALIMLFVNLLIK